MVKGLLVVSILVLAYTAIRLTESRHEIRKMQAKYQNDMDSKDLEMKALIEGCYEVPR